MHSFAASPRLVTQASALALAIACSPVHRAAVWVVTKPQVRIEPRFHPRRRARFPAGPEAGTTTAEYAIGTLAACAFAAVLYKILTGGSVAAALGGLIHRALGMAG
jgi:hypothetical protein